MMRILVTGASGFVGSHLIKELCHSDYEVFGLIRDKNKSNEILKQGGKPILGNLLEIEKLKNELTGIDVIIHSAAVVKFVGNKKKIFSVNIQGTIDLIDAGIESGIEKFIYISAAAIALNGNDLKKITEEFQPANRINNHYLESKLLAEQEILKRSNKIQTIILRPPVIWGSGMRIMKEFRNTIKKMGFPLIGDPKHHLATCHVKNLSHAISLCLVNANAEGIFLIGDDEEVKVKNFMQNLISAYDLNMGRMRIPRSFALTIALILEFIWKIFRLSGHPPMTKLVVHLMGTEFTMDISKAKKILNYNPVISVEQGLQMLKDHVA